MYYFANVDARYDCSINVTNVVYEEVRKFVWKRIVCKHRVPQPLVSNKGTYFTDKI